MAAILIDCRLQFLSLNARIIDRAQVSIAEVMKPLATKSPPRQRGRAIWALFCGLVMCAVVSCVNQKRVLTAEGEAVEPERRRELPKEVLLSLRREQANVSQIPTEQQLVAPQPPFTDVRPEVFSPLTPPTIEVEQPTPSPSIAVTDPPVAIVEDTATTLPSVPNTIPRILHQSWKTIDKIPARFEPWMRSWRSHNPNWTYVFWDDNDNLAIFDRVFPQYADVARGVSKIALADMARYAMLYELGGVYADADFECTKPFDPLANTNELFLSSEPLVHAVLLEKTKALALCNALMASRPRHPFWLRVLDAIANKFHTRRDHRNDVVGLTGPRVVKQTYFAEFEHDSSVHVYAQEYFYPEIARWNEPEMRKQCRRRKDAAARDACQWLDKFPAGEFTANTHAVHHWQCTWCIGDRSDAYVTLSDVFPVELPVHRPSFDASGRLVLRNHAPSS